MQTVQVGIVGASGYTGIELTRLLAAHPRLTLAFATSDRWENERLSHRVAVDGPLGALRYVSQEQSLHLAKGCALVFLATPAEASMKWAPKFLEMGVKVVDLSGAFRLKNKEAYPSHYGFSHENENLLPRAVYGLPEYFSDDIRQTQLLANPGCYATAVALSLAPLLKENLIDETSVVVNAASGVTGAGRKASEDYSFCEVDSDFRAYRVFKHQHTPEIEQTLQQVSGKAVSLVFTPHLLPIKRGILSTAFARLKRGIDASAVTSAFQRAYQHTPYVTLAESSEVVQLKKVVGTNRCEVGFSIDKGHPERLLVMAAIDNLLKGASGQALQNANLLLGFEETLGLTHLRGSCP